MNYNTMVCTRSQGVRWSPRRLISFIDHYDRDVCVPSMESMLALRKISRYKIYSLLLIIRPHVCADEQQLSDSSMPVQRSFPQIEHTFHTLAIHDND